MSQTMNRSIIWKMVITAVLILIMLIPLAFVSLEANDLRGISIPEFSWNNSKFEFQPAGQSNLANVLDSGKNH
jgi:inner membrane protein involved in colicin E2 resistance